MSVQSAENLETEDDRAGVVTRLKLPLDEYMYRTALMQNQVATKYGT